MKVAPNIILFHILKFGEDRYTSYRLDVLWIIINAHQPNFQNKLLFVFIIISVKFQQIFLNAKFLPLRFQFSYSLYQ